MKLKKTKIKVRAYCNDFEIEISGIEYYTIEKARDYLIKDGMTTVIIKGVTHVHPDKEIYFENKNYIDPTIVKIDTEKINQYLKRNQND